MLFGSYSGGGWCQQAMFTAQRTVEWSPTQTLRDIDNIDNIGNRDVYFHQLCHLEIAILMRREE